MRDHLANERTQLAWLRTGAAVMVVGLALARFADGGGVDAASLTAGGVLIAAGAGVAAYGLRRYRRIGVELRHGLSPTAASTRGPTLASAAVLLAVVVAAVVLVTTG
ncbi:hypothetical protein GCM10023340_10950 [Nocardioides marinquilinus]|uniref:DUF202 domain-containing protein n=1 Tax=Nocardioides marinquilinus TaxID=1210400 RepID=A0ABP9PBN0_9ACTN